MNLHLIFKWLSTKTFVILIYSKLLFYLLKWRCQLYSYYKCQNQTKGSEEIGEKKYYIIRQTILNSLT